MFARKSGLNRYEHPSIQESHGRRYVRLLFLTLTLAVTLALGMPPAPASAHAELLFTMPVEGSVLADAPSAVELTFDEPVYLVADGFQLYDAAGGHRTVTVKAEDATVRAALPSGLVDGTYVLGWRVISDDSHPESGLLSFSVGRADAAAPIVIETDARPVDFLYGLLTAVGYLGLFCLVGLTAFDLFVTRTAPAGRRLPWISAIVAVTAYFLLVPITQAREQGASFGALLESGIFTTTWSWAAIVTLTLAATGAFLMLFRAKLPQRAAFWAGTTGAGIALASVLPVGHTRTFVPSWLVMGADLVHAATAAIWLGGLVALVLHLARARRCKGDPAAAAVILGRFSTLAGGLVVLLGATGVILGVVIVGSMSALVNSEYGRVLLCKLALVAVIGALAAWNRFRLVPQLERADVTGRGWQRIALAMRLEVVGVVLVIGLTSVLTLQNPRAIDEPASTAAATSTSVGTPVLADLGTGHLAGRFRPGTAGANIITFTLTAVDGTPIVPLDLPQVTVAEPNLSLGPLVAEVVPGDAPGSYRATVVLPVAGQWKITAAVRVNELERPAAVADVVVIG